MDGQADIWTDRLTDKRADSSKDLSRKDSFCIGIVNMAAKNNKMGAILHLTQYHTMLQFDVLQI